LVLLYKHNIYLSCDLSIFDRQFFRKGTSLLVLSLITFVLISSARDQLSLKATAILRHSVTWDCILQQATT